MILVNGIKYKTRNYGIKIVNGEYLTDGRIPFTDELRAIISRANWEGFSIPPLMTLLAIDKLIRNLKDFGIWDKMDTYLNLAYNNTAFENFSKIDWRRPNAGLLNSVSSNTYTTRGWEGNGVDSYMILSFTPTANAINYQLTNAGRGMVTYKAVVTGNHIDGNTQGIHLRQLSTVQQRICSPGNYTGIIGNQNLTGDGFKAITRDSNTSGRLYNKDLEGTVTLPAATTVGNTYWLFRSGNSYGDTGISSHFMSSSLTATEFNNYRVSYNNYLTSIGLTAYA